jgi:hypothetical protein
MLFCRRYGDVLPQGVRAFGRGGGLWLLCVLATAGCEPEATTSYTPVEESPGVSDAGATSESPPATAKVATESLDAKPTKSDRIVDKTFDDIKFDIEPDAPFERSMLTDEIEALAGQRIRIRGWMLPTFQRSGIKQFVLVRDNQECCFGPGAALYDCIVVDMAPGTSAEFSTRPIAVEGEFAIDELIGPGDKHLAIYHLDAVKAE